MIDLCDQQAKLNLTAAFLEQCGEVFSQVMEALQREGGGVLGALSLVEIVFLDDVKMARVHGEFLGDATPTDVITFEHGEILIGVEVAVRQAMEYESVVERELVLYGIHGLLHLAGYDDLEEKQRDVMFAKQEEMLREFYGK